MREPFGTQRLVASDGTIAHYININGINKMHNWDGAAFIPQGNKRQAEYYIFGIRKRWKIVYFVKFTIWNSYIYCRF